MHGLRMGLGMSGQGGASAPAVSFASIFSGGENGGYARMASSDLYQDAAGTTPATTATDPIGRVDDLSGNGMHFTQSTPTARPTLQTSPNRAVGDTADDHLTFTCPTGGIAGTGVFYSASGAIVTKISYAAGTATLLPASADFQGRGLTSWLIIDRVLSAEEIAFVKTEFEADGGVFAFSAASATRNFDSWQALTEVTEIDLSAATATNLMFTNCDSLTAIPDIDLSSVTTAQQMFIGAALNKTIGAIDFSAATTGSNDRLLFSGGAVIEISGYTWPSTAFNARNSFNGYLGDSYTFGNIGAATSAVSIFQNAANLTTFPAGVFDNVATSCGFAAAFNGCSLDAAGVNNALISMDTAGLASVTIDIAGTNAAPTGAGLTAKSNLQGRGCTVNTN